MSYRELSERCVHILKFQNVDDKINIYECLLNTFKGEFPHKSFAAFRGREFDF